MAVDDLTVLENEYRWDIANTVLGGELLIRINIDLTDDGLTIIFLAYFLDDRTHHSTGTTPSCPKINHYGFITFQYDIVKSCICYF